MPRSLVTGITGQDGWYLSEILQRRDHEVIGLVTAGDDGVLPTGVQPIIGNLRDEASVVAAVERAEPDRVFNLAALSSVAGSWADPALVADVNGTGVVRLLHAVRDWSRRRGSDVAFVQASSAEIFGDAPAPQDESSAIAPSNPYGAAKAFAHQSVRLYRAAGLHASNAILFNHESPRRPDHFVTRKITRAVARIARGSREKLVLGDLEAHRDWGFAGDYMAALALIAEHRTADDYIIATGRSRTVADFVRAAFAHVGIQDWADYVTVDTAFTRAPERHERRGNPARVRAVLGWRPETSFEGLVAAMVEADLELLNRS